MRRLAAAAAVLVLLLAAVLTAAPALTSELAPPANPWWMRQACAQEDSVNCYWNAGQQGDGGGHSFFVRKFPNRTCWMYVERSFAADHDHCETNP